MNVSACESQSCQREVRGNFCFAFPVPAELSPMGNPFLEGEQSPKKEEEEVPTFTLAIISRRSRFRAGKWRAGRSLLHVLWWHEP